MVEGRRVRATQACGSLRGVLPQVARETPRRRFRKGQKTGPGATLRGASGVTRL